MNEDNHIGSDPGGERDKKCCSEIHGLGNSFLNLGAPHLLD